MNFEGILQEALSKNFKTHFAKANLGDYDNFEQFAKGYTWQQLREVGLLVV